MSYQPIKFKRKQYEQMKALIRRDFGNISLTKGIYIITYLYNTYIPNGIKARYKQKYYRSFDKKKERMKYRGEM